MATKRTTPAVAEPLTLLEVKWHLKEDLDDEVNDAYIESLITVARIACEDRIGRTLINAGWLTVLDLFPPAIRLLNPPILAVQSVRYIEPDGALLTLSPLDYVVDTTSEPGYIVPAYGTSWPTTQDRVNAVTVAYTAGYGDTADAVPAPLKQWMLLAIGDMYDNRTRSADKPHLPQGFADSLLDVYKIWGF